MNLDAIEPLKSLGIKLVTASEERVEFLVPEAGNLNDKGTVFAGSQYSGLVIAGWYLASAYAEKHQLSEKVAIKSCEVSYPKAAKGDLKVVAEIEGLPDQRPSGHWRALVTVKAIDRLGDVTGVLTADYRILV